MGNELKHRALVGEIQRLVQMYSVLPADVKLEILRFLKTPEMTTNINFRAANKWISNHESPMRIINYYVV
jgi:hypothetical protein